MVVSEGGSYPHVYYEMLFIGFSSVLGMGLVGAFLPILARDLDPSGTLVGYVVSAWFFARVFIELPSGFLSDRVGRGKLFVLGIALAAVGSLVCATAPSIFFLIVGRAVWGFGVALFFLNNTAILFDLFEPEVRGRALGTFQGIEFAGSLMGQPIGAFLVGIIGYYHVFYVAFALTSFSCLLSFTSKGLKGIGGNPSTHASQPSVRESLASLRSWGVFALCANSFARMFIMSGVMSTVFQLYLYEHLGFEVSLIGIIVGARTAGFVAATLASGYISDRLGRKPTILAGLLVDAACLCAFTVVRPFVIILTIGVVGGLGEGIAYAPLLVLFSDLVKPEFRGVSLGLYRTFMDVGGILGPIVFMLIATGVSIQTPFLVGALVLLTMAGLTATIRGEYKRG